MNTNDIIGAYVGSSGVGKLYLGNEVVWPTTPPAPVPYEQQYFTVEAIGSGYFYARGSGISHSINGGEWSTGSRLSLNQGDKVRFSRTTSTTTSGVGVFSANTISFKVYGNIESMEYGDNFSGVTSVRANSGFSQYFNNSTGLVDASNLILPATTLKSTCYYRMFRGCTNLVTAPLLPAPTLLNNCYKEMFSGCTSLMQITCLATSHMTDSTTSWVLGVDTTGGTFFKDPSVEVGYGHFWTIGIGGVPSGWTAQNYDPNPAVLKIAGQSIQPDNSYKGTYTWVDRAQYSGTSFTIEVNGVPITADTWDYSENYIDACGESSEISHDTGTTTSVFEVYSGYIDDVEYHTYNNSVQYLSVDDQTSDDPQTICGCEGNCWDEENQECHECPPEDPCAEYGSPEECDCVQGGGEWDGENCHMPGDCNDWEYWGYSSYEDCTCQEHGEGCEEPSDPCEGYASQEECDCAQQGGVWDGEVCHMPGDCTEWEYWGYSSYEECTCSERGENCPEEESGE